MDVTNYRVHNEQFHVKTFDFPIVMLSKGSQNEDESKISYNLRDLLYAFKENEENVALKINIAFRSDNFWAFGKYVYIFFFFQNSNNKTYRKNTTNPYKRFENQ